MNPDMNGAAPRPAPADAEAKAVAPAKLAHVVLLTRDLARMRDWYLAVLAGRVAFEGHGICFISFDDEHHRIALAALPDVAPRAEGMRVGMHHIAFTYRDLGELLATWRRLKGAGIETYWPINHGITTSMYYRDPDGNTIELQVDNFATAAEADAYMAENFAENPIGIIFDPEDLAARFEAGVPLAELRKRPQLPQGVSPLDMIRA